MQKRVIKIVIIINILVVFSYVLYSISLKYENYNDYNIKYYINTKRKINKKILYIEKIGLSKEVIKASYEFTNLDNNLVYYENFDINNKIIIFGHSGNGHNAYFKRLNELSLNDDVIIYNNGLSYYYGVYDKYLVNDYDTYILNDIINSKTLLLITCDDHEINKRLVIELKLKTL